LNVSTDLTGFQVIRPCGKDPEVMTSMAALLGRPLPMEEVRRRVRIRFAEVFRFAEPRGVSG
jgi:lipoate-protein ligase B